MAKVSVIIPSFNEEDYITNAIQSVIHQNYPSKFLEIIVVDGGSTDDTISLVRKLEPRSPIPIKIIETANYGPSFSRNIGWKEAKAPWIQFLDADDRLHPHKLTKQMEVAKKAKDNIAIIYSKWLRLTPKPNGQGYNSTLVTPSISRQNTLTDLLRTENVIHLGSQLIRKSWLEKVKGFDESLWLVEDVELMLRIAMAGGKFYKAPLARPGFSYYRRPGESLSTQNQGAFIEACYRNAKFVEEYLRDKGMLNKDRIEVLTSVYHQAARHWAEHDRARFQEVLEDIFELKPDFLPEKPLKLKWLAKIIGYERAELASVFYRRIKGKVCR